MGSVSRRLQRHLSWRAPKAVPQLTEGFLLSQRLERAAKQNNATDPLHFLAYLKQMRRGYDPKVDGASAMMKLVDDISDFEEQEKLRVELEKAMGGGYEESGFQAGDTMSVPEAFRRAFPAPDAEMDDG